jgi:hypothetical protein
MFESLSNRILAFYGVDDSWKVSQEHHADGTTWTTHDQSETGLAINLGQRPTDPLNNPGVIVIEAEETCLRQTFTRLPSGAWHREHSDLLSIGLGMVLVA